jgi:L-seryl-tRNA(Ser) seleniumtransferase
MLHAHPVEDPSKNRVLRQLPSVEQLLSSSLAKELSAQHRRPALTRAARLALQGVRRRLLERTEGTAVTRPELEAEIQECWRAELETRRRPGLRRVINATGVVLHTGLGRAPLAAAARRRLLAVAKGYANLELDLESGRRGSRQAHLTALLTELTGAEDALVVNNCAGAVLLALAALAGGRAAVISRGELVEIGGGFRMPEVMELGRVRLIEVGTTNKTRLQDYARAVSTTQAATQASEVALFLKVHRSNFALSGFTDETSLKDLAALGRKAGVPTFYDLGSGLLDERLIGSTPKGTRLAEPTVASALRDGADLVAFSGDKLLGGPQAGILVGSQKLIRTLQKHPLQRALRLDKLSAAALEATLMLYRDGHEDQIPTLRSLRSGSAELRARAERLRGLLIAAGLPEAAASTKSVAGKVGGGSLPGRELPSWAVVIRHAAPDALSAALRRRDPSVVARVSRGNVLLDVRAVEEGELSVLARAVVGSYAAATKGQGAGEATGEDRRGIAHA